MKASHYYITASFAASGHTAHESHATCLNPSLDPTSCRGKPRLMIRASGGSPTMTPLPPTICPAVQEHPNISVSQNTPADMPLHLSASLPGTPFLAFRSHPQAPLGGGAAVSLFFRAWLRALVMSPAPLSSTQLGGGSPCQLVKQIT